MDNAKVNEEQITGYRCTSRADIAATVKNRREEQGMKQLTLAELAGVTERTIQRLESGRKMDAQTLRRVARALGLAEDAFVSESELEGGMNRVPAIGTVEVVRGCAQGGTTVIKRYFEEMVAFNRWANEGVLVWMESHPENPELIKVFAHVIAENLPWLHVMRGEVVPPDVNPEPDWSLSECRERFGPTMDALAAFVSGLDDEDFGNVVRSSSPAGLTFENTLMEVLTNLLGHAEHHRGQIVSIIAKETGEYVPTVYMSYLRCRV